MIALEDLSVKIGDFHLDGITIEAGDGEYLVLLGPSGAGKTVLLEIIAGLRKPDTGKVTLNQQDMSSVSPEHRSTALVYQDYSLFPHMTAAENIAYGMRVQKRPAHEIRERVDTLLADLGISMLKDRYPGSLSGGEQQRIAIARALATNPSVLLLDEPFASLDPRTRDECIRVMQGLKDTRSITIIQVSHSGDEAYALADKVVVILGGRVAQVGIPDEIFSHPASVDVAKFIGMENILTGIVESDGSGHFRMATGSAAILLPATCQQGAQICIGIPAKCVRVVSDPPVFDNQGLNSISCLVTSVTWGKDTATLRLDGEISLIAIMQRTLDDGPIPVRGMQVYAVFKDTDVRIFSGA
jgi:ABC-type Fe3+/spermidine/putrescine transport system ATPase subunit